MVEQVFLSRGIDYLGDLGAKLRDLQGYKTLIHELIQNADDAPGASSMTFNIDDKALVVDNNGIFRDCGEVEKVTECPWKADESKGHRCDFHRFRNIASGDKRSELLTTGAFGIGFIAVYQITDQPELISAGRHWILHEDNPENERIEVCSDCKKCSSSDLPGTRFILPWVFDGETPLRKELKTEAVSADGPEQLLLELGRSLPLAMIFLKKLNKIEVKKNGNIIHCFERSIEENSLIITDGDPENDKVYYLFHGDFSESASSIREKHGHRIEKKRSTKVTIAIPDSDFSNGLMCAYLPTEHETRLPFYINADFFTNSERKRVILEEDYQSEWNRLALDTAAKIVGQNISHLPLLFKAQKVWGFISILKKVSDETNMKGGEQSFCKFWSSVEPHLKTAELIYTSLGKWMSSVDCSLLQSSEEAVAISVLEAIGIKLVSEELRPYQNILRGESVGISTLNIKRICRALEDNGMTKVLNKSELPISFTDESSMKSLWRLLGILINRQERNPQALEVDKDNLKQIAIAPRIDGSFGPCGKVFSADKATIDLFQGMGFNIPFLLEDQDFTLLVKHLCPDFTASTAISILEESNEEELTESWKNGKIELDKLFEWLENHRSEILSDSEVKSAFTSLLIFPGSGSLHKLEELALPGNFNDPLGLAELVDLTLLRGRKEFLKDIGMNELDLRTYIISHLPKAFSNSSITLDKKLDVIGLLANKIGEIKDDEEIHEVLSDLPLVKCNDDNFYKASECYFDNQNVRDCLDDSVKYVVLQYEEKASARDLYKWLGVSEEPKINDITTRVSGLAQKDFSTSVSESFGSIIAYLGKQFSEVEDNEDLFPLKGIAWLPAKGESNRWYYPYELFATYQDYLFSTQANFLGVLHSIQNISRSFLEFTGVRITPSAELVVKHLLHCSDLGLPVNNEVYKFLNDKYQESALEQLRNKDVLYVREMYISPDKVFWSDHPFGRYRQKLNEELRAYSRFLGQIGVREAPNYEDAIKVMMEVSAEFGTVNKKLDEDAHNVLMECWRILEKELDNERISEQVVNSLHAYKCVPNAKGYLYHPDWIFFENRAGLASKFGEFLTNNVISRPLGTGKAMMKAGVRLLGSAVEVNLLECTEPVLDEEITEIIRNRHNEFGRVLESQIPDGNTAETLKRLEIIQYESSPKLLVNYSLTAFNRKMDSEPENRSALYLNQEERLIFSRQNGCIPWPAISRELAIALLPEEDPGRIAAGIKEVLSAESVESASHALDELGYPSLDMSRASGISPGSTVGSLGTDDDTMSAPTPQDETPQMTHGGAIDIILGPGATPPTPPPVVIDPYKRKSKKLRSYVYEGTGSESQDPQVQERRSEIEQAGVQKVLDFEKSAGRFPKEMPVNNPGYDIESKNEDGKIERLIEVKSTSLDWGADGVEVTNTQFDKARDKGKIFWLYVVERANQPDHEIHRIQDPANNVTRYMFDDGWRCVAEISEPIESESQEQSTEE